MPAKNLLTPIKMLTYLSQAARGTALGQWERPLREQDRKWIERQVSEDAEGEQDDHERPQKTRRRRPHGQSLAANGEQDERDEGIGENGGPDRYQGVKV